MYWQESPQVSPKRPTVGKTFVFCQDLSSSKHVIPSWQDICLSPTLHTELPVMPNSEQSPRVIPTSRFPSARQTPFAKTSPCRFQVTPSLSYRPDLSLSPRLHTEVLSHTERCIYQSTRLMSFSETTYRALMSC